MSLNELSTLSEIILAMARLEVAPGEGALQQWRILLPVGPSPYSKMKSSTSEPSILSACARTPAGPRVMSARVISGMNF